MLKTTNRHGIVLNKVNRGKKCKKEDKNKFNPNEKKNNKTKRHKQETKKKHLKKSIRTGI